MCSGEIMERRLLGAVLLLLACCSSNLLAESASKKRLLALQKQAREEAAKPKVPKNPSAVTYTFSGGRFGDNLVAYLHAKWISYKYNMPLLYIPFQYSDQLAMDELEKHFSSLDINTAFKYHITLKKGDIPDFNNDSGTLYTIPYFPESLQEYERSNDYPYFEVDWNDEGFIKEIQRTIKPRYHVEKLPLPNDRITVAVHLRKRSAGIDDGPLLFEQNVPAELWACCVDRGCPFKFASDDYYQDQIKRTSAFFGHQPMYVYLFSDAPNIAELANQYQQKINCPNIEFDYRKTPNHHLGVIEDFFALTQFDCLIRVDSNFSLTASKLKRYQLMATPKHYYYHPTRGYPIIDQVTFTIRK